MTNDFTLALVLVAVFLGISITRRVYPQAIELLLSVGRPGASVVLLGGILYMYSRRLYLSSLVGALIVVLILRAVWTAWPRADARRLHLEVGKDLARFNPANSVDLQFANGTAKHDAPSMLTKPWNPTMLIFPPSEQVLHEMNGS
jgi:hypothetical protein